MKIISLNKKLLLAIIAISFIISPLLNVAMAAETTESNTSPIQLLAIPIFGVPLLVASEAAKYVESTDYVNIVTDPIDAISNGIMHAVTEMAKAFTLTLLQFGSAVLNYATSDEFLDIGYTSNDNNYVYIGWTIVRNVANATLVIGLVIIAISIILGYQENQAKKTLLNFIAIALLINFTPVICDFIITGSNIIMKSMITGGIANSYDIFNKIFNNMSDSAGDVAAKLGYLAVIALFVVVATVVYFLYALLFLARSFILWILVIISPIAFATKVFPQSKYIKKIFPSVTYWDDWWESFIQWCVIGIPAAMSIYLSNMMLAEAGTKIVETAVTSKNIFSVLLGCFSPFIFLIVGFMITISSGGQVGSFVGGMATGAWAATGGRAIGWGKEKVKGTGSWAEGRVGAAGSYIKEGAEGMAGVVAMDQSNLPQPLSVFSKEDREAGRQKVGEWKRRGREIAADLKVVAPLDAEKNKGDFDNYNASWKNYKFEDRQKIEKELIEKDTSKFLKGGVNNQAEYQRRINSVIANGEEKHKVAAYMHASGNQNLIGGANGLSNMVQRSKIDDIGKSIRKVSAKEAREKITAEAIENNPIILQNLGSKQAVNIMKEGSEEQRRALKESSVGRNNNQFANYLTTQGNIINDPNATQEQKDAARINVERGLKLANEIANNS